MNASKQIDQQIATLDDWRGEHLASFRDLVHSVAPELGEEFKWGTGVFTLDGKLVIAFSAFKDHTKFNFFKGASLDDPDHIFNSGLDSKQHRSINLAQDDTLDKVALSAMIRRAIAAV